MIVWKWVNISEYRQGLRILPDPADFYYRAQVENYDGEWHVKAWSVHERVQNRNMSARGEWVDCGAYKTRRHAKLVARRMAKMFEGISLGGAHE